MLDILSIAIVLSVCWCSWEVSAVVLVRNLSNDLISIIIIGLQFLNMLGFVISPHDEPVVPSVETPMVLLLLCFC